MEFLTKEKINNMRSLLGMTEQIAEEYQININENNYVDNDNC